jgi:hypothetical protein
MLNEIHAVFNLSRSLSWLANVAFGDCKLRGKLWAKKTQELQEGKVLRADSKVKEAMKEHDAAKLSDGSLSPQNFHGYM